MNGVRVGAAQFAVGSSVAENLASCVHAVESAAAEGAEVVVLPGYANHPGRYDDRAHAGRVACGIGGEFVSTVAAAAAAAGVYVKLHVTVADADRVTASNLLVDPAGEVIARADDRAVGRFLDPVVTPPRVVDTPLGRFGMYGGADGRQAEIPRALALGGAQVLLASLWSTDPDDARLHLPVRAAESKVWIVAANVIGRAHAVTDDFAGESGLYGPDGATVTAAPRDAEGVAVARLEPGWADDKTRPDGGDIFLARRPRLYGAGRPPRSKPPAAATTRVAVVRPRGHGMSAIEDAGRLVRAAATDGADLIVLPELFHYADGRADGSFLDGIAVDVVSQALEDSTCHVVTSLPDDAAHVGVLIGASGVIGRQVQMHPCGRHLSWQAAFGDRLTPFDLSWGRLVLVVGDDALYPEVFEIASRLGADLVAVPCAPAERWELTIGLPARSLEQGLNIVAAAHPGPGGGGAILAAGAPARFVAADAVTVAGELHPRVTESTRSAP
ncbi:carbon-nitrogen hydrolase family protein [Virgisporangium ochraceum]|uniref:Amidohydrolase n=1 Tax=Virgisporangium ochraceum TaxID=65505 RepID=A0A8J4A027_9ACTN|nr:carbon-nitrogen hydrolase family protein [Virgisporangium ochraceum]GIJ72067.1 amidohydrolase [Virgisporangium ochraceum]